MGQAGQVTLQDLAAAHDVATAYVDWAGSPREVSPESVRAVLEALGVPCGSDAEVVASLAEAQERPWVEVLPPVVVVRQGRPASVPAVAATPPVAWVDTEDGTRIDIGPPHERVRRGALSQFDLTLPDLPLGYHRLLLETGERCEVIVAPERAPLPEGRVWGWQLQLYAMESAQSWGVGDYADLRALADAAAADGAGVLLVNPLHAETPVLPLQDSPYSPSSRLFRSALHLRVQDCPEWDEALAVLRPTGDGELVDRQAAWGAKLAALKAMWPRHRTAPLEAFRLERGEPLERFAEFCVHAQEHGRDWRLWPEVLQEPDPDQVAFWCWVQLLVDEQLTGVGEALSVGVLHDLAVGVDPGGADAWAMRDVLVQDMSIGAPPDALAQLGQDWGLPPWHPLRLRAAAYAPFREMVRGVLRHAGGIRIDHVLGLSRLWWVPKGRPSSEGTYVRYDLDALLGVLALEATRAGAVVIGEDLGTVEPAVREALRERDVLGCEVLWFAQSSDGWFLPPSQWRAQAAASVTTHDLPTISGWDAGESLRLRVDLGQIAGSVEAEQQRVAHERTMLLAMLQHEGLLDDDLCLSLHRALVASPSRVVLASYGDAVGDVRQPNLPGTVDEYPNWRLPIADRDGQVLSVEQVLTHPGVRRLTAVLAQVR